MKIPGVFDFGLSMHHDSNLQSNPGRGWVVVRAMELTKEAIVEGLASGDFYASTGLTLEEVELSQERVYVRILQERHDIYVTHFIGRDGTMCAEVVGTEAAYQPRGDESYIRAVVVSSSGHKAWTQPVFLSDGSTVTGDRP